MEFVAKNDTINTNEQEPIINLTNDDITSKLFYFSKMSENNGNICLYLDKPQIKENLNFDCLFPSNSKIEKIYISNNQYPFYKNGGLDTNDVSYVKQSFNIIIDNNNYNIFSHMKTFKKQTN